MPNMTLAVPEELHRTMKNHPEIKWTEVALNAMKEYTVRLEVLDDITSKSRFTEKDALKMSEALKVNIAKRYKKAMKRR